MSQRLPFGGFKWVEETSQSNEDFIKHYNENSDVQYPEELQELHNGLPFFPERMKIEELVASLPDKKEHVKHISIWINIEITAYSH